MTVTVGGYGQSPSAPRTQPTSGQQAGQSSAPIPGVLQAEVTIAQVAAYERYLTYMALANSSSSRPTQAEMAQYFSNGAAATTVPSSAEQPGSAYFANGAEATRVPAPAASAQPLPPSQPSQPSQPIQPGPAPASAPLAPFWWVEGMTPAPSPAPSFPASSLPPPAPEAEEHPAQAMSFEDWLQSMGANVGEAPSEPPPALTSAEVEGAAITEPSAAVLELRPRTESVVREKRRERVAAGIVSAGPIGATIATFAAGLLVGALAMMRPRLRARV